MLVRNRDQHPATRPPRGLCSDAVATSRLVQVGLGGRLATKFCELVDDARERLGGIEFVGAGSPQKPFDVG